MKVTVELDFMEHHWKAILAEAEKAEITPEDVIQDLFSSDTMLNMLDDMCDDYGIKTEE